MEIREGDSGYYMHVCPKCGNSVGIEKRHLGCMARCGACGYRHLIRENDGTTYVKYPHEVVGISPRDYLRISGEN
jgi:DNA-directed RNA polymerase subunit RPC12/RpoP